VYCVALRFHDGLPGFCLRITAPCRPSCQGKTGATAFVKNLEVPHTLAGGIDPSSARRLLVLASPGIAAAAPWPVELHPEDCTFCPDAYALATRLAAPETSFAGILLDPRGLPRAAFDLLAVLQRHRPLPLWFLDAPVRPIVEQLLRLGARPVDPARVFADSPAAYPPTNGHAKAVARAQPTKPFIPSSIAPPPRPAAPQHRRAADPVPAAPVAPLAKNPTSPVSASATSVAPAAPVPNQSPKPDDKPVVSAIDRMYDSLASQPVLTDEELRALLRTDL